jgi:hypothetical protein
MFDFMALLCTWIYENTVTSQLIAPTRAKVINDVVELVDVGYKVEYFPFFNNTFDFEALFSFPFMARNQNVSHKFKMDDYFIPINGNIINLTAYRNAKDKKALHLIGMSIVVDRFLMTMKKITENEECYRIQTPLRVSVEMAHFDIAERVEVIKILGRFWSAGLIQGWTDWHRYFQYLVVLRDTKSGLENRNKETDTLPGDIIKLANLKSLLQFWAVALCFVFFVIFIGVELQSVRISKNVKNEMNSM